MLINAKLLLPREDQILTLTGVNWNDYEKLDSPEYSNYLISYLNHEITIVSPGRNHERIARLIGILIVDYCEKFDIPCFPFGITRLKEEQKEGKEPDEGYAFYVDKERPDLAVEVNLTSGSINDLTKYKYLKIKEVWIWQNQEIKFYFLRNDCYEEITQSVTLQGISSDVLIGFINRGFSENIIDIKREFLASL